MLTRFNLTKFNKIYSILGFALLTVIFVALVIISNTLLHNVRVDLTANKLYSLSEGTEKIVSQLEEPITIKLFISEGMITTIPFLQTYAQRIEGLLQQYAALSKKIKLQIIDPEPFSTQEDLAANLGVKPISLNQAGDRIYFGIAISNAVDETQVMAFLDPKREAFFEYELTKAIYQLSTLVKPKIGIMSWIPLHNNQYQDDGQNTQAPVSQDKIFYQQIKQQFTVQEIDTKAKSIDKDIAVLLIIHPTLISEETEYAIDQYVLRGGKAIVFVDPNAETLNRGHGSFATSSLDKLFKSWGVVYDRTKIIADRNLAIRVNSGKDLYDSRLDTIINLTWLGIAKEQMNKEDVITRELGLVRFISGGFLNIDKNSSLKFEPILQTTTDSKEIPFIDVAALQMTGLGTASLLQNFQPSGNIYTLAARLSGKLHSAFPEKQQDKNHINSTEHANLFIIADVDLLEDDVWAATRNVLGETVTVKTADNGALVFNAIDNFIGNQDLISLRSRNIVARPFSVINKIRNQAEQHYRQTELALQQKLKETEQKIEKIQLGRNETNKDKFLTIEQQEAIQNFLQEKSSIRKQLREVQHALNKDIEYLGGWIKFLNIVAIPILLLLFAVVRQNNFFGQISKKRLTNNK